MSNLDARPGDARRPLRPMDPDQANHFRERLRALADLISAGAPVLWIESDSMGEETISITVNSDAWREALYEVATRAMAGAPDTVIRVRQRERPRTRLPRPRG